MSMAWWKLLFDRFFGWSSPRGRPGARSHRAATPAGAWAEDAVAAAPVAAGETAPTGAVAAQPAAPAAEEPSAADELRVELTHSLAWRARLLLEQAGPRADLGDGPALVKSLLEHGDDVVRQFPLGAQRALAMSRNPECNLAELVALFERDPTLTQSLLKTANSPWYRGHDDEVVSIAAAIQRIGMQAVENLLLASIVSGTLCKPGQAHARVVGQVWSHMLRTAPLARTLAPAFWLDPEDAFTLGLLHDVGKLVVFDHVSALRSQVRREVRLPERFLLDTLVRLHEPLGGMAAMLWGLEPGTARALSGHHRRPVPETSDTKTEMVYVAERLDLALNVRFEPPDWDGMWHDGVISAGLADVRQRCEVARAA